MADDTTSTLDEATEEETGDEGKLDLDVEISDAGPCLKHVRIVVPRHEVDAAFDDAILELSDSANVPGFRSGRVPRKLIQKRFQKELKGQVLQKLLLASLEQVSEEKNLEPINEPDLDVEAIEIPDEGDFEYEFEVEVRPTFDLPDYDGLEIERVQVAITDEQVDQALDRFLSQYGILAPQEGPAQLKDWLTLSARFTHNGELLHEIDEFEAKLLPRLAFWDAEVENFGELFEGAAIGERRTAEVTVSLEAEKLSLRGETVHIDFELLDLKRIEKTELNRELFDRIGVEDEETLRDDVFNTLERQALYRERQNARTQVLSKITESADWELPESLVSRQIDNALRREILEMRQAGFSDQEIRSRENELRQKAISSTTQALKEHFVLDKIAEAEEIEVSPAMIETEIVMMAMQQGESPRRLRSRLQKSGKIENLEAQLRERMAIDAIMEKATFIDIAPPEEEARDQVEAVSYSVCAGNIHSTTGEDEEDDESQDEEDS